MNMIPYHEDRTWEAVMQLLSAERRLQRFCKLPRHELNAIVKLHGRTTPADLARIFVLAQGANAEAREEFLSEVGENRIFAMLYILGRAMKCWVETDIEGSAPPNVARSRWRVAHS